MRLTAVSSRFPLIANECSNLPGVRSYLTIPISVNDHECNIVSMCDEYWAPHNNRTIT